VHSRLDISKGPALREEGNVYRVTAQPHQPTARRAMLSWEVAANKRHCPPGGGRAYFQSNL
jgi:hypothetical protein